MILVSIIFFEGIGYLKGAQEALDLPQAVAPTGTDCAQPRGSERVKTPHHMDFYTKWHMSNSVKFWNQSHGVILNHSIMHASFWPFLPPPPTPLPTHSIERFAIFRSHLALSPLVTKYNFSLMFLFLKEAVILHARTCRTKQQKKLWH